MNNLAVIAKQVWERLLVYGSFVLFVAVTGGVLATVIKYLGI